MSKFHNPYHFVPVEKTAHSERCLTVDQFKQRELGPYSHAAYHQGKYSGRIVCRLTTTDNLMFVGAKQEPGNDNQSATTKPFELEEGKPAIPASTLRGLLSSIAETASNSALRVLNDQVLSYRKAMEESLSAIGMVKITNEQGKKVYHLKPLALPTLVKKHGQQDFTFNTQNEMEKKAYAKMFEEHANLKVYLNGYDADGKPVDSLLGKKTYLSDQPEFYYAPLKELHFNDSLLSNDESLHIKGSYVVAQDRKNNIRIKSHEEWKNLPSKQSYTRGILRVLGKKGRDMPNTKTHEIFIPYPEEAENWDTFPILPEAIERFHQLADDRTDEEPSLPYELLGMERNNNSDVLKEELAKKGLKNGDQALRLKAGDLVYFRPTMKNSEPVVTEVAFSSIWRGRVEDEDGHKASVHDFFAEIDPELLPFNEKREKISPAELLFGFVEHRDEEQKKSQEKPGLALAGRVQVSFGQVASKGPYYDELVTLKILASPKLPCPSLYFFDSRYTDPVYTKKTALKPEKHKPQGRKAYLHHRYDPNRDNPPWKTSYPHEQTKQKTKIKPVKKGTQFFFHIDFNNLSEWELGLLCYALRPTEAFRHKLGMGKSIGLGTVCIDPVGLFLINREERYARDAIFTAKRYHSVWKNNDIELPTVLYPQEAQTQNSADAPSWQSLRDLFRETMSPKIRKPLELLGDPSKVTQSVQTHY
ncbi:Cold-shock DNA-binding domain protein [Beggiatoa sp. PS]|nr:Cold-shock DNA-binding domain protein [Beggiatoa sp. PS]